MLAPAGEVVVAGTDPTVVRGRRYVTRTCAVCGATFRRPAWRLKGVTRPCCSVACRHALHAQAPAYRGRDRYVERGYVFVRVGLDHPLADARGFALEHRVVLSAQLGRWLTPDERVAWINGDRTDNRVENLVVIAPRGARVSAGS